MGSKSAVENAQSENQPLLGDYKQPTFGTSTASSVASSTCSTPNSLEANVRSKLVSSWNTEFRTVIKNSIPMIITFAFQNTLALTSVVTVGPLGKTQLAAVTLGSLTANITAHCFLQGLNHGLDTLCSQAFGAGEKKLVGLYLQRMVCFLFLLTIPLGCLWWNSALLLERLIDDPDVAEYAGYYLRYALFGLPAYALFDALKRYCQAQALYRPSRDVILVCAPLNVFLHWFLVWRLEFGFVGAPIALVITNWAMASLLILYVAFVEGSECWGGFDRRALQNWWPMIVMALPSMLMLISEWLAWELLTIFSARIGANALATQSILVSVSSAAFNLFSPVCVASSNRVAYFIGAQEVPSAKRATFAGLAVASSVAIGNIALILILAPYIPFMFTKDPDVIDLTLKCVYAVAILQIPDVLNSYNGGILRAVGRQDFGGIMNISIHYPIGVPIGLYCCFGLDYGLWGLWMGFSSSILFTSIVGTIFLMVIDWNKCSEAAVKRAALGLIPSEL